MVKVASAFSKRWFSERIALYGSVTTSETVPLVDPGKTEKLNLSLSEYSSLNFSIIRDPSPLPVPPPSE